MSLHGTLRPRLSLVSALAATATAVLLLFAPIASADPLGAQFPITNQGPPGDLGFQAAFQDVAYNPTTDQHLVVFIGTTTANTTEDIYGQLIDAAGNRVGGSFRISTVSQTFDNFNPATVLYNPTLNEFLVAWDQGEEVWARRVDSAGTPLGPMEVQISASPVATLEDIETESIAWSPDANAYIVVWKGNPDSNGRVFGRIVDPAGNPVGAELTVGGSATVVVDDAVSVVYNPVTREFFTVFRARLASSGGEYEIFGQRLDLGGTRVGPTDFRISDMGPDGNTSFQAQPPDVAYNSRDNQYQVAWSGDDNTAPLVDNEFEVFGQLLAADGSEIGANDFRISDMGPDGNTSYQAFRPRLVYNPNANEYFASWHGDDDTPPQVDNEQEIWGQVLAANGSQIGTNDFRVSQDGPDGDTTFAANRPAVDYNSRSCDYLDTWFTGNPNLGGPNEEWEVFGRRVAAPACVPPPTPPTPPTPPAGPAAGPCANPKTGTNASETIDGTAFGDLISGLGGDDIINGLQGDDCLNGGAGRDRLSGASGIDTLSGGTGGDRLSGASGGDRLSGGSRADRLSGGSGNDRLSGGSGNDRLSGGSGRDRLSGGFGKDRLAGGTRADRLSGGPGNDRITGGSGRNRYSAGGGNDVVNSANNRRERVNCGKGANDRVRADDNDRLRGCEIVTLVL